MWSARQVGIILTYAAIPLLLVIGSVALAVAEGAPAPSITPSITGSPAPTAVRPTLTETRRPADTTAPTTTLPAATATTKPAVSPTASPTTRPLTSSPTASARPTGSSADTVPVTATAAVPSLPVAPQAGSCGPFPSWSKTYVVRPGDTLFRIALRYRTSVWELRQANCKDSATVVPGEQLWVPGPGASHWGHRYLPALHWHRWQAFPWVDKPGLAPDP